MLQALLAFLLAACGEDKEASIPVDDLLERFPSVPAEELEEHLSLLNLVNFGGGCYTIYAELRDGDVHVDKELWGDTFRLPPRLTPLEARAIRLALEYVGPMIAVDAHTPLARVRKKLEETFGAVRAHADARSRGRAAEEDLVSTLARGMREHRLVEIEYQKEVDAQPSTRLVEPYSFSRALPWWYVHTWDRTSDGERSFRLDRMRSATLTKEKFEPREGFDPVAPARTRAACACSTTRRSRATRSSAAPSGSRTGARCARCRSGATSGSRARSCRSAGDAIVLEPAELRARIAARARELAKELGVERLRARV